MHQQYPFGAESDGKEVGIRLNVTKEEKDKN